MSPLTPFVESNALLAVMSGDEEAAKALIWGLLPNERRALAGAAYTLTRLAAYAEPPLDQADGGVRDG